MTSRKDAVREHYESLAASYAGRSNPTCDAAYRDLIARFVPDCPRVLELGGGSEPRAAFCGAGLAVTCDFTPAMLLRAELAIARVAADAAALPFADETFDGVISFNLLEHVPEPEKVIKASCRVLRTGGVLLAVTPNGDWSGLLEILERLHLKLPEGPHRFLTTKELRTVVSTKFKIMEHRPFAALPVGPWRFASLADKTGFGLLQYVVARKGT